MSCPHNYFTGVNKLLCEQIHPPIFPPKCAEGHPSVWLYFSCTLLSSWVFPICEESYSVQYAARPGTTTRHRDKSQHRETQVYLHSTSIHVWSCRFSNWIFFTPLQALSLSLVRGYDVRAQRYLPCLCRGGLIPLESVKAQREFEYHIFSSMAANPHGGKGVILKQVVLQSSKDAVNIVIYVTIS